MVMRADSLSEAANTQTFEGRRAPITPLGLTAAERQELEWFFGAYEAEVGLRSSMPEQTFGAATERRRRAGDEAWSPSTVAVGNGRSGGSLFDDPMPELSTRGVLRHGRAVYHALLATSGHHVTVLWLLYGARRPSDLHQVFGEVAPIVHLTQAVEEVREAMAARDGEERYDRVTEAFDAEEVAWRKCAVEGDFWHFAGKLTATEERLASRRSRARCQTARGRRITSELEIRAAALRETLGRLLQGFAYDGRASAQATAMGSADREATPQGAIRWRLDFHGARLENGSPHPEALQAHKEARKVFIATTRREAERMRIAAAVAYRAARRSVGP